MCNFFSFLTDGTLHDGDGNRVFETRADAEDVAWDAAGDAARAAAGNAAWAAAWAAARDAARDDAWDDAWDASLYIRVIHVCDGLPIAQEYIDHVRKRMDVWRHGYGVWSDVDGVLYCYNMIG